MIKNKKYNIKKDREERILEALESIAKNLERMANMTENTYLEKPIVKREKTVYDLSDMD